MEKIKIQIAKDLLKIKAVFFRPEEHFHFLFHMVIYYSSHRELIEGPKQRFAIAP